MPYDVVIAGASIAGCTAAIAYGRAGLRVGLIERRSQMSAHKALCGHFILGGTRPTLRRLGIWEPMLRAGAAQSASLGVWTPAGWSLPATDEELPSAISLRRVKLDPLLRRMAAETPGVDLRLGSSVVGIVRDGRRVAGLDIQRADGTTERCLGRLVVGADGHRSTVARLAGVEEDAAPNQRFLYWAYYAGVRTRGPGAGQVWMLDPDVAVCVRTDDDLTLIGVFPSKARLPEFDGDRVGAFERAVAALPDAPDLSRAERVSQLVGTRDYPCIKRHPVPEEGLALIGDAAMASDPVPAVGCGWAFRSAEWLVDSTVPELSSGSYPRQGLRDYRRAHRLAERYDKVGRADARARPANAIQKTVQRAATHDADIARRLALFAQRAAPPSVLLNPRVVARAALLSVRRRPDQAVARADEPVDAADIGS